MVQWKIGDRVVRIDIDQNLQPIIDKPRHGVVVGRSSNRPDEVSVEMDDGSIEKFLDHGLEREGDDHQNRIAMIKLAELVKQEHDKVSKTHQVYDEQNGHR